MMKKTIKKSMSIILSIILTVSGLFLFSEDVGAKSVDPGDIPQPVKVVDFYYGFDELKEKDSAFSVVDNAAKPVLVQDEQMGQVLKLGKAVIKGQQFGSGQNLIADESEYSTINLSNPFKGNTDLVEYKPYEDVKTKIYRNCEQPDWKTGVSISYWIKTPSVNSNIVGFNSDQYLIQADDYAKYLTTVRYGENYNYPDNASYADYHLAPIFDNENKTYDLNGSRLRFTWAHSEMWLDASSSFYFEMDNNDNERLNAASEGYGIKAGSQNGNCFCINSWIAAPTFEEALENGTEGESPLSQPDEWHYVTVVIQNDWVLYYLDGEEIDIEENYSSYGGNGLASPIGNVKPWKRFNKGAGSRYGYGNDKVVTYNCTYGNYVTTTIMEFITAQETDMTIGGGNVSGDGYNMFANTDEVMIKNIVFYDKMLNEDQIEYLAEQPHFYDGTNPGESENPISSNTPGLIGDANLDNNIDAKDALAILKSVGKIEVLDGQGAVNADVDSNGKVDASDALDILKYSARIIDSFSEL